MYVSEYVCYLCVNTCTCTLLSNDVWTPEVDTGCLSHLLSSLYLEAGSLAELRASTDSAVGVPCFFLPSSGIGVGCQTHRSVPLQCLSI